MYIEIGGTPTVAIHQGSSNAGVDSAFILAECNAGQGVLVKAGPGGAVVWGRYQNMKTSIFTGSVLSLMWSRIVWLFIRQDILKWSATHPTMHINSDIFLIQWRCLF